MAERMEATVRMDSQTFWKVAAIAEQFEMRVDEYLAELAVVASRRKLPPEMDPVIIRWRMGWSDREIARELAMTNEAVADRRRRYGLPANRKFRAEEERVQPRTEQQQKASA